MRADKHDTTIPLKYMPNKSKILEYSDEENKTYNNFIEMQKENNNPNNKNNKYKPSIVYFYCPYNQSYTKFQNYKIEKICELIKIYQLKNYFLIQIDNDNLLYEEILKMQFKNESQIIHKMFDLKLDYSFSPFQDSLFFNMSILTDFFYDQIEKYLIQIFFHNHGIYIINKDSCEYIHQILMEKFIFYYCDSSQFFEKTVIDKNNKFKSTKILINDFKLKNIIQNFQEGDNLKSQKKHGSTSKSFRNTNKAAYKKNGGSLCDGLNKVRLKRLSSLDLSNDSNKNQKQYLNSSRKENFGIPRIRSLNNIYEKESLEEKENEGYSIKKKSNACSTENIYSNQDIHNNNLIFNNYETSNFKNSLSELEIIYQESSKRELNKEDICYKNLKCSDYKRIEEINKEIVDKSRGSSLSSNRSKMEIELNEKNKVYSENENIKCKFRAWAMSDYERKGSRDNDINSDNTCSRNNIKELLKNDLNKENMNMRSSDDNLNLRKLFTFNENKINDKDYSNNNEDEEKGYYSINNIEKIKNNSIAKIKNMNIRRLSDDRCHNSDVLNNFKEYEDYLEKIGGCMNKSHNNIECQDLLDLRNKLNNLSTNNIETDNYLLGNPKEKDDHIRNDFILMNGKIDKQNKNSEENTLILNLKDNLKDMKDNDNKMAIVENDLELEKTNKKITFSKQAKKSSGQNKRKNFSTDELIYYLFVFSLEKLEEFTESLIKEADSLKGIYLELSEKERKDFFRRIHSMEVSMHIIHQETKMKKKFFKYAKKQFRTYNKLSNDFYFKNNFNFFLELMISKITQIDLTFETLENFLKMIKENYLIIIEDNTEKENVKLNYVMKVLTILTTIYAPMNIIPGLFGMNVKVPWVGTETDSLNPFVYICVLLLLFILIQLFVFKRLKWL